MAVAPAAPILLHLISMSFRKELGKRIAEPSSLLLRQRHPPHLYRMRRAVGHEIRDQLRGGAIFCPPIIISKIVPQQGFRWMDSQ